MKVWLKTKFDIINPLIVCNIYQLIFKGDDL